MDERIKNIIIDEILKNIPKERNIKRGFFAGDYIRILQKKRATESNLITEEIARGFLKKGIKTIKISRKTIITPLARELFEEKGVKISYEGD
ncbi:MAG: hypothetical protein J7L42_04340 [Elusimicrobia bacterium]|nr:hypothetical protein [Elusimicrobiota bacterium]